MGKIKICGTEYTIQRVKDLHTDSGLLDGIITYSDASIRLGTQITSKDRLVETFLHEVVHGIDTSLKLDMSEENVQRMANALHQMGVSHFLWRKANGQVKKNSSKSSVKKRS